MNQREYNSESINKRLSPTEKRALVLFSAELLLEQIVPLDSIEGFVDPAEHKIENAQPEENVTPGSIYEKLVSEAMGGIFDEAA